MSHSHRETDVIQQFLKKLSRYILEFGREVQKLNHVDGSQLLSLDRSFHPSSKCKLSSILSELLVQFPKAEYCLTYSVPFRSPRILSFPQRSRTRTSLSSVY